MSFLLRSLLPRRRGGEDSEDGGGISFGTKRASGCICFLRLYALSERTVRQKDPFPLGVERGGVLYRGTARLGRRSRGRCGLRERVFCGSDRAAFIDEARKIPLRRRFLPVSLPAFQFGGLPAFRSGDGGQLDDGCRFSAFAVRLRAGVSVYNVSQYKKGVFSKEPTAKQTAILPAAGGAVGVLAARFLLTGQPQQTVFRLTGALLLILSLLISIPGINILKAVLCKE